MKISALIIAHNEEACIADCIESVLAQSCKPDEVVLIAHNCTDSTIAIAEKYPITVIPFRGQSGIVQARIEGLKHVTGDIVCCIDGDSYAKRNWIQELSAALGRGNILVGSWVKFKGTLLGELANLINKYLCTKRGEKAALWIWGPSFAFWAKDIPRVQEIYVKTIELSEKLTLSRNPEDYWLALFMDKEGSLEVTNRTCVIVQVKEKNNADTLKRSRENLENAKKILSYFKHSV